MPETPDPSVLDRIFERGDVLRQRRAHRWAGASVLVMVLLVGIAVPLTSQDDRQSVSALDGEGSDGSTAPSIDGTDPTEVTTTTLAAGCESAAGSDGVATTGGADGPTIDPGTVVESCDPGTGGGTDGGADGTVTTSPETTIPDTSTTTSTTTLVCRDSYDPACGEFRWDPDPGPNQPVSVTVTMEPANPHPGDEVTFHVVVDDPDHQVSPACGNSIEYGDGYGEGTACPLMACRQPFGPHTPPAREPGQLSTDIVHTYADAGSYTATFVFDSGSNFDCDDPYASSGERSITFEVTAL